jgi:hypothetical protein
MPAAVALLVSATLAGLAIIHVYWALGRGSGGASFVPQVNGRPAFVPSSAATLAVAFALAVAASLVALTGRLVLDRPVSLARVPCYVLAAIFLARAIGDFRLVGFFKRIRSSRFARLDSLLFSPLCLALAAGIAFVAYTDV